MVCPRWYVSLDLLSATCRREEKSLLQRLHATLFDYGNYESWRKKKMLARPCSTRMMMMMMMLGGKKSNAYWDRGEVVRWNGAIGMRPFILVVPRGKNTWLRNCGWEGNVRCDDHRRKRGLHFVRMTLGDEFRSRWNRIVSKKFFLETRGNSMWNLLNLKGWEYNFSFWNF